MTHPTHIARSVIAAVLLAWSSAACLKERATAPTFMPPDIIIETPAHIRPVWTDAQSCAFGQVDTVDSTHRLLDLRGLEGMRDTAGILTDEFLDGMFHHLRNPRFSIRDTARVRRILFSDEQGHPDGLRFTIKDSSRIARNIEANIMFVADTTRTVPLRTVSRYGVGISSAYPRTGSAGRERIERATAMPFYVINTGDSIVQLPSIDGNCPNILEALDRQGIWRPIEYILGGECANCVALGDITIPPSHYLMGRIIRYAGPFHTQLRIRLAAGMETLISVPFTGTIDPGQFMPYSIERYNRYYLGAIPERPQKGNY